MSENIKRWYVIPSYSGHENQVVKVLKDRIQIKKMDEYFGEIIVPTEEVVEMRRGKKRTSERKFFPGYVLVQMVMSKETWHFVKDVPYVMGFVGGVPEKPAPISDAQA